MIQKAIRKLKKKIKKNLLLEISGETDFSKYDDIVLKTIIIGTDADVGTEEYKDFLDTYLSLTSNIRLSAIEMDYDIEFDSVGEPTSPQMLSNVISTDASYSYKVVDTVITDRMILGQVTLMIRNSKKQIEKELEDNALKETSRRRNFDQIKYDLEVMISKSAAALASIPTVRQSLFNG